MNTDWPVWPIFITQLITFFLLFFPRDSRFLGLKSSTWVSLLLLFVALAIGMSLYHDSFNPLSLFF